MTDEVVPLIPVQLDQLQVRDSDSAFVAFASPETRCLGVAQRFAGYSPRKICLLQIEDEKNSDREENIAAFRRLVSSSGPIEEFPVRHSDVVYGVAALARAVASAVDDGGTVTVDISTFPKAPLLLVLRALARVPGVRRLRLLYTEPEAYESWLEGPVSYGVRPVTVVPTFAASYRASRELVLIVILGYERDRALGVWQSIEPNRTVAVIGRPSYHPEWEGKVEMLNAALLAGLEDAAIFHLDPRNPIDTYELLAAVIRPDLDSEDNFYIAPLGTKPQTVGVHYFCNRFPSAATVAYASPVKKNLEYISKGIGPCWELPRVRGQK